MKVQRIYYLDILRVLATIAVIVIHVSSQSLYYTEDVRTFTWQSLNFWDSLMRWCVPIFVMISGVLFLNPRKKVNLKKLFTKNISRIIYVAIFWHLVYGIYNYFEAKNFYDALRITIEGYSHLWFLHMIIGLYLIVPFLRKITEDIKMTRYFLALSAIFTVLLPTVFDLYDSLAKYRTMSPLVKTVFESLGTLNSSIYFHLTLGFSAYFVAGYYFNHINLSKKWRYVLYFLGFSGILVTILGTGAISYRYSAIITPLYSYVSLNVMLTSLAIFIFIKELGNKINWEVQQNHKWVKWLTYLSSATMGIYLIHFLIIHILVQNFHLFEIFNNALIAVPIITGIVFVISLLLTVMIRYIPLLKKFMM